MNSRHVEPIRATRTVRCRQGGVRVARRTGTGRTARAAGPERRQLSTVGDAVRGGNALRHGRHVAATRFGFGRRYLRPVTYGNSYYG